MTDNKIDPSTVPADQPWWVRLPDGTECAAQRNDPDATFPWHAACGAAAGWRDAEVTLLYRLVPEPETAYVAALRRSESVRGDMLAEIAASVGWNHGTAWPADLAERVRALRVSRDAWSERAGAAERRADDAAGAEPWLVLRAAEKVVVSEKFHMHVSPAELNILADPLEREHTETARRDKLIEAGIEAAAQAVNFGGELRDRDRVAVAAVVDAVLAEGDRHDDQ